LESAESAFRAAVDKAPDNYQAWLWLGVVAYQLENFASAVTSNQRALAIRPQFAAAKYNLGAALLKVCGHEEALQALERISPGDEGFSNVHNSAVKDTDINELRGDPRFVQLLERWKV
jgi:tetratricopeptide (TPR) repeat protein